MAIAVGAVALASVLTVAARAAAEEEAVRFNRDIRPILSNKCFACHGPDGNKRESDLRFDQRDNLLTDRGGYAVIVPGDAANSELVYRITHEDEDERMPPEDYSKTLTDAEIELLTRWVEQGGEYEPHWSFIPPERPDVPENAGSTWANNPIDEFILRKLRANDLEPSPDADRITLLRRLHFDLTGLPPTPDDADAFLNDASPGAYEREVERLLDSPHYGERMAIYWLDLVRFADTNGYHSDEYRSMWPYRDYVIDAFNDNKPFDQFTIEQLAGDLLPDATIEQKIASGYNRLNQITSEGGAQPGEYLTIYAADRIRTTASVWLGVTMGCAQCHDHKFDPFTAKDFYSFGAFFADIKERGKYDHGKRGYAPFLRLPSPEQEAELDALEEQLASLKDGEVLSSDVGNKVKLIEEDIEALEKEIPTTLISESVEPREMRVLPRGNWMDDSGEIVQPKVPTGLPQLEVKDRRATRLDLAEWMVDPSNPLTARTYVNRLWKQFFGTGISKVLDDLGSQGEWPTHPELLDWLAVEFIESGWDVKHLVRLLVTSNTYRQRSFATRTLRENDPYNRLYARQSRWRVEAELIRDNALAVSGLLNDAVGGPSVHPYQPEGYYSDTYASVGNLIEYHADAGPKQYRRGMYTMWRRTVLHPAMLNFDAPTREECTAERPVSNTPLQALQLLNDPSYVEAAWAFAERILTEAGAETDDRITFAWRAALSRAPTSEERDTMFFLVNRHRAEFQSDPEAAQALLETGLNPVKESLDAIEVAAWTSVARTLFNLHEFITRS